MKTLLEVLNLSAEHLNKHHIDNAKREAEMIIADALGVKRIDLYLQFERPLNEEELEACRTVLLRRCKGEPSQYIHGEVEFFDCTIKVTPDVLIPRHETEILVDKVARALKDEALEGKVLLDLCCGSGCIGIALKKRFPALKVYLSDLSSAALSVAKENAAVNGVEVIFLEGDLLEPFLGCKADYLVCNPPYLSERDYAHVEREVRDYEPKIALVSGATGFEMYERLSMALPSVMNSGGKAWFEIGTGQGDEVKKIFDRAEYVKKEVENDWAGHDRFFFLEIE
jgi:release factor glutamine methyltransferase